jgi:hypothetical protein
MVSGGSHAEVARWLTNFLASHAKREDPRLEVELEGPRAGDAHVARLRLGERLSEAMVLEHAEVAAQRGTLAWCAALAERTRALAAALLAARGAAGAAVR